jgi:hypothetical protein
MESTMPKTIKQAQRELREMDIQVLHDTTRDAFHCYEKYGAEKIGTYSRDAFLARWCGVETYEATCALAAMDECGFRFPSTRE